MTFDMQKSKEICEKCNSCDPYIDHDYWNAYASGILPAALDRIKELEKALISERANCIMAYEWDESLPELDETADEERYRTESREQLHSEGLL